MSDYLARITVTFPDANTEFTHGLAALIDGLGHDEDRVFRLTGSSPAFYPQLAVDFHSGRSDITTDFSLSAGEIVSVKVENSTWSACAARPVYRMSRRGSCTNRLTSRS